MFELYFLALGGESCDSPRTPVRKNKWFYDMVINQQILVENPVQEEKLLSLIERYTDLRWFNGERPTKRKSESSTLFFPKYWRGYPEGVYPYSLCTFGKLSFSLGGFPFEHTIKTSKIIKKST